MSIAEPIPFRAWPCWRGALALVLALAPAAHAGDAQADAWAAAMALKQPKPIEAAAAFEAFAKAYPDSPRAVEALVEAGVSWFSVARSRQALHRSPPAAIEAFARALELFQRVTKDHTADPAAGRAQYMCGSTRLFLGDFAAAEQEYGLVLEKYPKDAKYASKSLERRAATRRHLLDNARAIEDLRRYQREFPKGEDAALVARCLQLAAGVGKPPPALDVETWIQGDPVTLGDLRGDVVAIYFFASWCENCAKEKDFLEDVRKRYEPMGLRWIGVVDHQKGQTVDSVRAFLATEGIRIPVMMDRGRTVTTYLATQIPDLVLIDRLGRVRWHDNPANLADRTIETLLTEDPEAPAIPAAR